MKKHLFKKIFLSVLVVFVFVAILTSENNITSVNADTNINMSSYDLDIMEINQNTSISVNYNVSAELKNWTEEVQKQKYNKDLRYLADELKNVNTIVDTGIQLLQVLKDSENGADFDTAAAVKSILSMGSGIACMFPPIGTIVGTSLGVISSVYTAVMGGVEAPSEVALLKDSMNQSFDNMSKQIAGLHEELGTISNEISESTNTVISEMDKALYLSEAQEVFKEFYTSSGKDDFSYKQYKNYFYGSIDNNSSGSTAYYSLLQNAQFVTKSPSELKYYYDKLYSSIIDNSESFSHYVFGTSSGKSIVQYYYDILKSQPDYEQKNGISPELAAIQFAYDLYETQKLSDYLMLICNNYHYTQMLLNDSDFYNYGTGEVFLSQVSDIDSPTSNYSQALIREEEFKNQFIKDIAYILNIDGSYVLETEDDNIYLLNTSNKNGKVIGHVFKEGSVYLNTIPNAIYVLFDLSREDLYFEGENIIDNTGVLDFKKEETVVSLMFNEEVISSITFTPYSVTEFSGGTGTPEDPYLISNANQFSLISDGMDKYYRLVDNISFDSTKYPLGYKELNDESIDYEEFTGIIDGNGFTLSNLTVIGDNYAGVFGIIGEEGIVKNINFDNVTVKLSDEYTSNDSVYTFNVGIVAGLNKGTIRNCHVFSNQIAKNSEININLNISTHNNERNINLFVGGIAGKNENIIQFVEVENLDVNVRSILDFKGGNTATNKNLVYIGGVCGDSIGEIKCAVVRNTCDLNGFAKSFLDPNTTKNPYVTCLVGGIIARSSITNLSNINYVYSEAKTVAEADAESQSGYKEGRKYLVSASNSYVPKSNTQSLNNIKASESDIINAFPATVIYNTQLVGSDNDYNVKDLNLNQDNIQFLIDGEKAEYKILNVYGFDTTNSFNNKKVTVLLSSTVNNVLRVFIETYSVNVFDYVESFKAVSLKEAYNVNEELPDKVTLQLFFASGSESTVTDVDFDFDGKSSLTSTSGEKEINFVYDNVECKININVICKHNSNYNYSDASLYEKVQTVDPTCMEIGYDEYRCLNCNETVKTNYKDIVDHKLDEETTISATCQTIGYTGKVYCVFCKEVFDESVEIPMLPHIIVKVEDEDPQFAPTSEMHYCTNGNHWEYHNFVLSESYEAGGVVYTYTCYDCDYVSSIKDTNIILDEDKLKPTVVISDGYALSGGDLVTVYVQLINNPGVYGAQFGIKFDERLTLVSWSDGMLFEQIKNLTNKNTMIDTSHDDKRKPLSCERSFYWLLESSRDERGTLISPDGTLLKLVFKLPEDAKLEDVFNVSVVYSTKEDYKNGFIIDEKVCAQQNIPNEPQKFIAKDGVIRLVDHLPGDVNNDNCVDILDVIFLANRFVSNDFDTLEKVKIYGDVNLSGKLPDISDASIILRSLIGGYGEFGNILYHEYSVLLNSCGYNEVSLDPIYVDLYGENNSYESYLSSYDSLMQTREGYKFLGWYTSMDCTCEEDKCTHVAYCTCSENNCNHAEKLTNVQYINSQKIQTLYARWEKNSFVFEEYGYNYLINGVITAPEEAYNVTLKYYKNDSIKGTGTLLHEFDYWLGSNGVKYYVGDAVDITDPELGNITLTAVWKGWTINGPSLNVIGYDPNYVDWCVDIDATETIEEYGYEKFVKSGSNELYGKWTKPIMYSIMYNLNGGTFENGKITSIAYDRDLNIDHPVKIGYKFIGWTITGMDSNEHFYFDDSLNDYVSFKQQTLQKVTYNKFINLHANGGTVTFEANWESVAKAITVKVTDVTKYYVGDSKGNPSYGRSYSYNALNYKTMTIYYSLDDPNRGITKGYYFDEALTIKVTKSLFNSKLLSISSKYNDFEFSGLYGSSITDNGHTYATLPTDDCLINSDCEFVASPLNVFDLSTVETYIYIKPKRYNINLDINSSGILENVYTSGTYKGNNAEIKYDASTRTYTFTPNNSNDPYAEIGQYVYLSRNTTYFINLDISDNGSFKVYYAIDGEYSEDQTLHFYGSETYGFKVNKTGYYNLRFDNDTGKKVTVSNFWISPRFTRSTTAYFNEKINSNTITMPEGLFYNATGYTDSANRIYYLDGDGVAKNYYNISGDSTLYCQWNEQKYSGTYIKNETDLITKLKADGSYHIVSDITMTSNWNPISVFNGTLNGHNFTIYDLSIIYSNDAENPVDHLTVFGFVRELSSSGLICNLNFNNLTVDISKNKDGEHETFVGGIVGFLNGGSLNNIEINNSYINGHHHRDVKKSSNFVSIYLGGFVGRMMSGTITKCSIIGDSQVRGKSTKAEGSAYSQCFVGGIVGYQSGGSIQYCSRGSNVIVYSLSSASGINATSRSTACGIMGYSDGGSFQDCISGLSNLFAEEDNGIFYDRDKSFNKEDSIYIYVCIIVCPV